MSETPQTTDTTASNATEQSLDDFETEFFSGTAPEPKPVEEVVEKSEETTEPVTEETETSDEEESETPTTDEEVEENEAPKKESRAEKRIRDLVTKTRELERLLEEKNKAVQTEEPSKPVINTTDEGPKAPHWDDEDSEGNKVYPLGQFDPKFNADLVRYTIQEENRKLEEQRTKTEQGRKAQEAEEALQTQWEQKLAPVQERYPDFVDKGQELIDQFADLEPNYAKYLTDTIRSIDNGAEVLYYLANDLELANEIVRQGPALATVALGRISAKFEKEAEQETPTRTKVTNAPPPPPKARGTAPPKTKNLDDLDEFEKAFFG
jgi:hypothetical protein